VPCSVADIICAWARPIQAIWTALALGPPAAGFGGFSGKSAQKTASQPAKNGGQVAV